MSAQDPVPAPVSDLSRALLQLHKALLDAERVSYERLHGRIASNGEFYNWCSTMRGLPGCGRCLTLSLGWTNSLTQLGPRPAPN